MMTSTCTSVSPKLSAFRDGELPVADHVEVCQHLRECAPCRTALEEMDDLGLVLRRQATLVSAAIGDEPELHGLAGAVVSRVFAEQEQSWPVRVRRAFDDMHLVWAGLSATAAVIACAGLAAAIVLLGASPERADSLRALVETLSGPGTDLEPRWSRARDGTRRPCSSQERPTPAAFSRSRTPRAARRRAAPAARSR